MTWTEIHRGGQKFIGGTEIYRGDRNGPVLHVTICYNCICRGNYSLALCSIIVSLGLQTVISLIICNHI